jgi:tetratricopeptide (TPR) repeat protein
VKPTGTPASLGYLPWILTFLGAAVLTLLALLVIRELRRDNTREGMLVALGAGVGLVLGSMWWGLAGGGSIETTAIMIAGGLFGLSCGAALGFVLSSYSGEQDSVGKVRDLLFTAAAGAALSQVTALSAWVESHILEAFWVETRLKGVQLGNIAFFFTMGVLGMFYLRRMVWNPGFARKQKEMETLSKEANQELAPAISPGADGPRDPMAAATTEQQNLADKVISLAEEVAVDPEKIGPAQALGIARSYLVSGDVNNAARFARAALRSTEHRGPAAETLAASYEVQGRHGAAARIIEQNRAAVGANADHLLGYYLLWVPSELESAISHSSDYLKAHPQSSSTLFNRACGYAQLYGRTKDPKHKEQAMADLAAAINLDAGWRSQALRWTERGGDFESLAGEKEFMALVGS